MRVGRFFHARNDRGLDRVGRVQRDLGGSGRRHRRFKRLVTVVTVSAISAGGSALGALPAMAALGHVGPGVEVSGVLSTGKAWLGAVEGTAEAQASGWLSWCITAGYDAPSGAGHTAIDYVDDALLAAVIVTHEGDGTELSRAAISYLAHTRHETGTAAVSAASRIAAFVANTPQVVKDQAASFLSDAAAVAGPYTAEAGTSEYVTAQRTGVITVHPVVSSNGTPLVGYPMSITLTGPAVFDETGTKTWTGTTPAGDIRLPWSWDHTANGEVTWHGDYSGLPRRTLTKVTTSGQIQDTLTYGLRAPSDPEEITVPGTPFEVIGDFALPPSRSGVSTPAT